MATEGASPDLVRVERRGAVAVVTLNRPPVNALSAALLSALRTTIGSFAGDPAVRAIVLTGGRRAFSAGADIAEMGALPDRDAALAFAALGHRLCDAVAACDRPTIAAVEGFCLGGGLELALACHLRVAATTARMGLPEISLGLLPGFGGTQRLPRLIGVGRALAMMLEGEPISGERAAEIGLVNRLTEPGDALTGAVELAQAIAARSSTAAAAILRVVGQGIDAPLTEGLRGEMDAIADAIVSPDGREGTRAFLEKRPPRFVRADEAR